MAGVLLFIVGIFFAWFALMMLAALPSLVGRVVTWTIELAQKAAH